MKEAVEMGVRSEVNAGILGLSDEVAKLGRAA